MSVPEVVGLHQRTCDQCAMTAPCFVVGEHYICEDCQAHHERALDAAHAAIRATELVPKLRDHDVDRLTWAAVQAYIEYEADQ